MLGVLGAAARPLGGLVAQEAGVGAAPPPPETSTKKRGGGGERGGRPLPVPGGPPPPPPCHRGRKAPPQPAGPPPPLPRRPTATRPASRPTPGKRRTRPRRTCDRIGRSGRARRRTHGRSWEPESNWHESSRQRSVLSVTTPLSGCPTVRPSQP